MRFWASVPPRNEESAIATMTGMASGGTNGADADEVWRDTSVALAFPGAKIFMFHNHGRRDVVVDEEEMITNHGDLE